MIPAGDPHIPDSGYLGLLREAEIAIPELPICGGRSAVQVNPNREQFSAEEAYRGGIAGAARRLNREPALALAWIIVGKQVGCPGVPAGP